jgi:phage tail-like protein
MKFRLLDTYVGWSCNGAMPPAVLDDTDGLRLAPKTVGVDPSEVWRRVLPARLAKGCGRCDWYLLTPAPARLLRREACSPQWRAVWTPACDPRKFDDPVALAAWGHRVAIGDRGAGRIWIWDREGEQLSAELKSEDLPAKISLRNVVALGFAPTGELLAAVANTQDLLRFGPDGSLRPPWATLPPDAGRVEAIGAGRGCEVWVVTRSAEGSLRIWRAPRDAKAFAEEKMAAFQDAFEPTGLGSVTARGFCMVDTGRDGLPISACYDWYGRPISAAEVGALPSADLHEAAELETLALDSGIPRCRWHRVQVDADVPTGARLVVQVASTEDATASPDPHDWRPIGNGTPSLDFLIDQPPGRYLRVRLKLTGNGKVTPVVRRIRLDFPRATSLDFLPPVYREDPRAEDFTERFLSLFDAALAEVDRAVERSPALLDIEGVPDEVLPWLASFLDLTFDASWDSERRRAIVRALPRLYRMRGTVAGLKLAIQLIFDSEPAIQELAAERSWGAVGRDAVLRGTRLFGRSRARFTLGRSALSRAPLKSYGNPDHDPLVDGAYRFRVLVPLGERTSGVGWQRLVRLVEAQKPAHTQATVRSGGSGFVIGPYSAVGVDSALAPPPAPVVGRAGNVRLRRMSVLWPARRGRRPAMVLGSRTVVGTQTVMG